MRKHLVKWGKVFIGDKGRLEDDRLEVGVIPM